MSRPDIRDVLLAFVTRCRSLTASISRSINEFGLSLYCAIISHYFVIRPINRRLLIIRYIAALCFRVAVFNVRCQES